MFVLFIVVVIIFTLLVVIFATIKTNYNGNNEDYIGSSNASQDSQNSDIDTNSDKQVDTRLNKSSSNNSVVPDRHVCYLTFDDGPSKNTERILEILDKYDIKATWFVKAQNQDLDKIKNIWDKGHQVAVHTFTHKYEQIYASTNAFWEDYNQAYSAIEQILHFKPANMFRFPGGSTNSYSTKISNILKSQASQNNLHYYDWNMSCGDGANHTSGELVFYATEGIDKLNSACLLMHDSEAKDTTVEALEAIIQSVNS